MFFEFSFESLEQYFCRFLKNVVYAYPLATYPQALPKLSTELSTTSVTPCG